MEERKSIQVSDEYYRILAEMAEQDHRTIKGQTEYLIDQEKQRRNGNGHAPDEQR